MPTVPEVPKVSVSGAGPPDGSGPKALPSDKLGEALARIRSWQAHPNRDVACPVCDQPGLSIIDQSARPYAEWYALTCARCDLDAKLHIPLSPPG